MTATGEEVRRGPSHRMQALQRANTVRQRRAELKQAIRVGEMSIVSILGNPPEWVLTAPLSQMLLAVPGYGQARVSHLLERCRISPLKTIGALSERQQREVVLALADS
jgi:hypothetical protein